MLNNINIYNIGLICNENKCSFCCYSINKNIEKKEMIDFNSYIEMYLQSKNVTHIVNKGFINISYEYIFNIILQINDYLNILNNNQTI